MNNFIMFVGTVGAGKSSFIEQNEKALTNTYGINCVISSDSVIEDVAFSLGLKYSDVFKDTINLAGKYIEAMIGILSLQKRNFILDQTNLTAKSRQRRLGLLTNSKEYTKIAVVFDDVAKEVRSERLGIRGVTTGKVIPPEVVENMEKSFQYPKLEEGFDVIMTVKEFKETLKEPEAVLPAYGETKFA